MATQFLTLFLLGLLTSPTSYALLEEAGAYTLHRSS
nr:MAG TPA: hypothetical protein [Caudoviricetes sp.]